MPKIIIDLSEEQFKGLKTIPYGSIASKIIYDKMKQGAVIVDGEYIKKEDTLKALHDFWDEYLGYDGDGRELMLDNESVINSLPTYSIPPVATINVPEEKIQEFIHSKANVVSSEFSDSAIEKIRAEIQKEENILYHDCEPDFSKHFDVIRVDTVLEIIDKHIGGRK